MTLLLGIQAYKSNDHYAQDVHIFNEFQIGFSTPARI